MKFSQMKYERPDLNGILQSYGEITAKFPQCASAGEQMELIGRHEKLSGHFRSMATIASIHNSIDTTDPVFEKEIAFYDENGPVFEDCVQNFYRAVSASRFKKELEKETGGIFFRNIDLSLKTLSPAVIDLRKKENALVTEYEKLLASAHIDFDGKTLNLSEIQKYSISPDRNVRGSAWGKIAGFFTEHAEKLDEIYGELVQNRTEQAKKLGYENYVQLGYDRLGRNCYGPAEIRAYREQIVRDLVPVVAEIKKGQAERLGLDGLKFHDDGCLFPDGNPAPKGDREALVGQAKKMYHEMDPLTGEFFDFMLENELMDLDSKKGKAVGGYCTDIEDWGSPFIFANFNGTAGDVEVLTHEAGHAFASYVARSRKILETRCPTMDAAETHSMSMELFSRPWDPLFFGEKAEKFHVYQLEMALDFIPYGCLVDEFQETMYKNPGLTPAQRKQTWRDLERKYRPWIDFGSLEFFRDGGGYQRQHHIYSFPLYYIDYCLAQTTALEFWAASEKDWKNAFARYLSFVRDGGSKTYVQLVSDTGLELPFHDGCIKKLSAEIREWMRGHEKRI